MAAAAFSAAELPVDIRLTNAIANVLFALFGIGLALATCQWAMRLPMFSIRAIQVDGELSRNSVSTIRANALPRLSGNFFTIDLQTARGAFESVPWVRQAVVQRVWPDRLRVHLQEHHAAALWQDTDGNDRLVDTEGEVFDANIGDVEDDGLPMLSGPDGSSSRVLTMYRALKPMFDARLDASLDNLKLSGRGSWRAELDTGAVMELGRGEAGEVLDRADRFARTLPQVTGRFQHPLAYADLRHLDGYAVKLRGVMTTPDAPQPQTRRQPTRRADAQRSKARQLAQASAAKTRTH
ncbi:MAG TPA: cell division protein FtsQ/DivIB [Burkholderiaceae bacterium]|nr:cell division protein FtsQ/DivIB [Burkholderiaceae bacterium]